MAVRPAAGSRPGEPDDRNRPPIRVAVLSTVIDFGGIERVLLNQFQYANGDVELSPVFFTRTDARDRSFFERLNALGVKHETIYVNLHRPKYVNPILNIWDALVVLRRRHVDLIHTHGYRADLIGLALSRYLRTPVVSTCHGLIEDQGRLSLYKRLDVFLLRHFNRVIAVSQRMKEELLDHGLGPANVVVIANAVGATTSAASGDRAAIRSRLGVTCDEVLLGFVGRLSVEKGLQYLIESVGALPHHPSWRLVVIGEGPQRAQLEERVRGLGLSDRITFVGFQSDMSAWYPAMDAFVLPSLTEGTPMALLEAMAYSLPVVASNVGGVPAVITSGENGLLVTPADVNALAAALRDVITGLDLREALGEAACRTVRERYDVRVWTAQIRGVYEDMLRERRRTA